LRETVSAKVSEPMKYEYQIIDSETLGEGYLTLRRYHLRHRLFAGGWSPVLMRERLDGLEAAFLLPYDPVRDEVVLVEQFRVGAMETEPSAWVLEAIGGALDRDEDSETVVRRESVEEAGIAVMALESIGTFMISPGTSSEHIHLFCGQVDATKADGIHGLKEEGEDIRVEVLPADAAISELYGGRIKSASTILALQWLALHRDELRRKWTA
jgi:ADP-ribose pyrophosphatase